MLGEKRKKKDTVTILIFGLLSVGSFKVIGNLGRMALKILQCQYSSFTQCDHLSWIIVG